MIWRPSRTLLILGVIRVAVGGPHRHPTCCLTVMRPGTFYLLWGVTSAVHSQHGGWGTDHCWAQGRAVWSVSLFPNPICPGLAARSFPHRAGFPWGPVAWPSLTPTAPSWPRLTLEGGPDPPGPWPSLPCGPRPSSLSPLLGWERGAVAPLEGGR